MNNLMNEYKLIEAGTMGRPLGKRDMVFCIIYCKEGRQYENYDYFLNSPHPELRERAKVTVPTVLATFRGDGKLGFVGGNVEKHHKDLVHAIKDEMEEEFNMINIDESKLKPFATYANDKSHISTFLYEVSYEEIKEIQLNAFGAKHMYSEVCAPVLLQLQYLSIPNLMNQVFAGTGKLELNLLIEKEFIGCSEQVKKALQLAKLHFEPKLRNNGKNYYEDHILKVYNKTKELVTTKDGCDEKYLIIAILHDVFEDTNLTYEYISSEFGEDIAEAIQILTIDKSKCPPYEFIAVKEATKNEYTKVVRFADRLSNLEQTSFKTNDNKFIEKMINKTRAYYIPNFEGEFELALKKEVMRLVNELHHCPYCYGELKDDEFAYDVSIICSDCGRERESTYL